MFDHERLEVYRVSLDYIQWVSHNCAELKGNAVSARDKLIRLSQSIVQNIAEGTGKKNMIERREYFQKAHGFALESASILDVLVAMEAVEKSVSEKGKELLKRIVTMLSKITSSADLVHEELEYYNLFGTVDELGWKY